MNTSRIGISHRFAFGDREAVDSVLKELGKLGVMRVRVPVSWAEYLEPEGEEWYEWLLSRLAKDVQVLPSICVSAPSKSAASDQFGLPADPGGYVELVDGFVDCCGSSFESVEIWNEPNRGSWDDWNLGSMQDAYRAIVAGVAGHLRDSGKTVVLGGITPANPAWLDLLFHREVMRNVDVVGLHGFPESGGRSEDWTANVAKVRDLLERHHSGARLWISETGYSTSKHDEFRQLEYFVSVMRAPVDQIYWNGLEDGSGARGLKYADGTSKLLHRLWTGAGIEAVEQAAAYRSVHSVSEKNRPALITGGAGFIGTNVADRLLSQGTPVIVFDSLARPGVERNLEWLREKHGDKVEFHPEDVRSAEALRAVVPRAGQVFNFSAQVAVTTSLEDPITDFEKNARGTLNLLEEIRRLDNPPSLVFTSTNKVYGGLEDVPLILRGARYEPECVITRRQGIGEDRPLDFHSPYGCSKGSADQYVIDYARTFGIRAVVFRMSCIYGLHQFGTEDQGWVAHFLIQALKNRPITIYGDGKQVRDILFVEDLVEAFLLAQANMDELSGQAFNMGGGPSNTISLLELLDMIEDLNGSAPDTIYSDWRPGDQRYYVSDTSKFRKATGWAPKVTAAEGIEALYGWLGGTPKEKTTRLPAVKKVAAR